MQTPSLDEAITLAKAGEIDQAGMILAQLVRENPNNLAAWTWLEQCVRTERQREWCQEQIQRITKNKKTSSGLEASSSASRFFLISNRSKPIRSMKLPKIGLATLAILLLSVGLCISIFVLIQQGSHARASTLSSEQKYLQQSHQESGEFVLQQTSPQELMENLLAPPDPEVSYSQNVAYLPGLFSALPTPTSVPLEAQALAVPDLRGNPHKWKSWPITPNISENAKKIWRKGVEKGNDPHAFSVLGDCHSQPNILFGSYADGSFLENPDYKPYRKTLKYFSGSWSRSFVTVQNGMSVASAFNPMWARNAACNSGESPLACELRLHNPGILIISLGTNWGTRSPDDFENYLRQIVDFSLENHVLPLIATKGDPGGPNNPLNERMVKVAYDYDIPLWNFWVAIQDLPNQGLKPWERGGVYLSVEAWGVKRETGLMTLDAIRKSLDSD